MDHVGEGLTNWADTSTPLPSETFYSWFTDNSEAFRLDEGLTWDFKDEWPFSLSDNYFCGIARLICAFSNSAGGVIIFGVHDQRRTGGHNKVVINYDKFKKAVEQTLGRVPSLHLRSYTSEKFGNVDALYVGKRSPSVSPFRFLRTAGKYEAGIFWVRRGNEVVAAAPTDYATLFCHSNVNLSFDFHSDIEGSLPPSPATLKKFVGRIEVLDSLFTWLERTDEPRSFLYGKGGSGKTTIAYEFCRLLRDFGVNVFINGIDNVDAVIFLSAKEKSLEITTGKIVENSSPDFSDEESLLKMILYYGGWTSDKDYLNSISLKKMREELSEFLDINSCIIVIDDIDTLTTKNIDSGSDYLYRTLCRSKKNSKVLYTLRNAPTQSLTNSIEVPGLQGAEFEEFVAECARQFKVPAPSDSFRDKTLSTLSERRPLVIETVIALVRTTGNYERAKELFEQHAGDDIRAYVFSREWEALTADTIAKLLLAALSELRAVSVHSGS